MSTPQEHSVVVREITLEAEEVYSLKLESRTGVLPTWEAGAHIDLVLPNRITRQYSIVDGDPGLRWYRIAVQREHASRGGSEYVHYFLRPGQQVTIKGPRNNFRIPDDHTLVFIAAGIGITPILPMVREAQRAGRTWHLHYGGRSRTTTAFLDHLEQYGSMVSVWLSDSTGRIPVTRIVSALSPDATIVCCGPASLLDNILDELSLSGQSESRLHAERFKPRIRSDWVDRRVVIRAAKSGKTVIAEPHITVLDALLQNGIRVAASCRAGVCGTCEVRVLSGLPEHRDDVASSEQHDNAHTIMPCVSRAVGEELTLDV